MRVLYHTEVGNGEEGRQFNKIIDVKNVTFYPLTKEVQVGNRFYEIPDDVDFAALEKDALNSGTLDVTEFNFSVINQQQNNRRNNNRKFNNGGYGNNRRRY